MAVNQPKLFVIVLNWNRRDDLLECLTSVRASTYPNNVIVIDNASKDDSVAAVREKFPENIIIENKRNMGFSGNNIGLLEAVRRGAEYVLLLNNDTSVDSHCFEEIIRAAEETPQAGILSPRICYYSNPERIWYDGGTLDRIDGFLRHGQMNAEKLITSIETNHRQPDYISGCAMLIRSTVIRTIGVLDTRYFMYWEDADYSLRAKRAGYQLLQVSTALVFHKVSRSIGGSDNPDATYYIERNRYLVSNIGVPPWRRFHMLKDHVRRCFWSYCSLMAEGRKEHALAVAAAGWDCLIGRRGKRRGSVPRAVTKWMEARRIGRKGLNETMH